MLSQIHISIEKQELQLLAEEGDVLKYAISSAKNGLGQGEGSYCTPTGKFRVCEKYGGHANLGAIFKGRKVIGLWHLKDYSDDDLILTRIIRLEGMEPANANTYQRYIYLHGTNHEACIGKPRSKGCIRLVNKDIISLYSYVHVGTIVTIR